MRYAMRKRGGLSMTYSEFTKERITQLRLRKGVSEYKMSYDLGHSKGYINNISSGKALPSLAELFAICDYFQITPSEFFDMEVQNPEITKELLSEIKKLSSNDLQLVISLVRRMVKS